MVIREWKVSDIPMLQGWHESRHGYELAAVLLPPLGFVVELDGVPIAALFCYQSYGVGVAFIDIALSRPGTSFLVAKRAFNLCLQAIILACDDTHKLFRINCDAAITRVLTAMGFKRAPQPHLDNLYFLAQ
jgi:hypothetical protein